MASATAPLSLSLKSNGDQPSLVVSGQVDHSNVYRLVTVLDYLVDQHERCVSLNLADVHSIDSTALRCLTESATQLNERQRRLHVSEASGEVRQSLGNHLLGELICKEENCTGQCCGMAAQRCRIDLFTLPSETSYCREARLRVQNVAEAAGLGGNWLKDVLMAVGEAVTNAVRHGHSGQDDSCFTVGCYASSDRICVSVSDSGPGFMPEDVPTFEQALFAEHGRGIHCMNALMDEVTYNFNGGTTIRLVKAVG